MANKGIIRINYGFDNVIFELRDSNNKILYTVDRKSLGFSRLSCNVFGNVIMAKLLISAARKYKITDVVIYIKYGNNLVRSKVISKLNEGLNIIQVKDLTPIPHNACQPPLTKHKPKNK